MSDIKTTIVVLIKKTRFPEVITSGKRVFFIKTTIVVLMSDIKTDNYCKKAF